MKITSRIDVEHHYRELMQEIQTSASVDENFSETQFATCMFEFLENKQSFPPLEYVGYKKDALGIKVSGWAFDAEVSDLILLVSDYRVKQELENLTEDIIDKSFNRIEKFVQYCQKSAFVQDIDPSIDGYSLFNFILNEGDKIQKIKFVLISNTIISDRVSLNVLSKRDKFSLYPCSHEVWEMKRHYEVETSLTGQEDIVIDCTQCDPDGIECLSGSSTSNNEYKAYLMILKGDFIASLYDEYGERLLEQNVRTFLQFRGKINKGIRNTILKEPDRFFAYNNGLTATSTAVEINSATGRIQEIHNLQIVNGGQTMASIFTAKREAKSSLSNVYVQMKLTVINSELEEEIVPKISEYANTQNKVNAADFWSNHPFHQRMQDFSRRLLAPALPRALSGTYWYYERTRGQYNNAIAKLTTATDKKKFLLKYPKHQMFTKTDLAKYLYSWDKLPYEVSKGAQKCFALYVQSMTTLWDVNEKQFNERFFKEAIAKALIFKFLDKVIMKASWYGGFKANIITYTIAKFKKLLEEGDLHFDLIKIWEMQVISIELQKALLHIARYVNNSIQESKPDNVLNITEWCKKRNCWDAIVLEDVEINQDLSSYYVDQNVLNSDKRQAVKQQHVRNGIEDQVYVVNKGKNYWDALYGWLKSNPCPATDTERDILYHAATQLLRKPLSEKQSAILIVLEKRAIENGF